MFIYPLVHTERQTIIVLILFINFIGDRKISNVDGLIGKEQEEGQCLLLSSLSVLVNSQGFWFYFSGGELNLVSVVSFFNRTFDVIRNLPTDLSII